MVYPPPPGQNRSTSSTPSSLPAKPPPSANPLPFAPRSVKTTSNSWDVFRPPAPAGVSSAGQTSQNYGHDGYGAPQHQEQYPSQQYATGYDGYAGGAASGYQGSNYGQAGMGSGMNKGVGGDQYDPDVAAQMAAWHSAYAGSAAAKPANKSQPTGNANTTPLGQRQAGPQLSNAEITASVNPDTKVGAVVTGADGKEKTVVRSGGGKSWQDSSLLEWDPSHPRLFVGNLAGEVTDETLLKAFAKYPSIVKARVVRDKRTTKSKGFGFVSFQDSDDYFQAAKEMQGKYIGSHPVLIKRSTTEIRPTTQQSKNHHHNKKKGGGQQQQQQQHHSANTGAGIEKKQPKRKNGLKILG